MLVNTFELNNIGAKNNKAHAHYFTVLICLATWRAAKLGICTHFTSINLPHCSQSIMSLMYVYYTDPHLFLIECLILVVSTSLYHRRPPPKKSYVLPPGCIIYIQGFPNSSKGWRKNKKFYCGGRFFYWVTGWGEPEEERFWWFKSFSKLKTAFCEYWTSIKIKIKMTCVQRVWN